MRNRGGNAFFKRKTKLFRTSAGALLAVFVLGCQPSAADTLAAWIGRGYVVLATVKAAGAFHGCRKNLVVALLNGNSFACDFTNAVNVYNPTFTLLRNFSSNENALVSGETEYVGTLIFGETALLGSRLRITTVAEPAEPVTSAARLQPLEGLDADEAGRSIEAVSEPPAIAGIDATGPPIAAALRLSCKDDAKLPMVLLQLFFDEVAWPGAAPQ